MCSVDMRSPKTRTICFAVIGLVVLAFASMKPIDAKYRMAADKSIVATTTTADMWRINGIGYSLLILAAILVVWLLLRVSRALFFRDRRRRDENVSA